MLQLLTLLLLILGVTKLLVSCYCHPGIFSGSCLTEQLPAVKTPLGEVRGYYKISYNGRKFSAFEGIPYAKPPIGERRFEEPEPIEPWQGIWNATYLTECAQTLMLDQNKTKGDEDCLYINVYVPRERLNPKESLDVIVHIHGGTYMYASSNNYSPPDLIMDEEVIYVTFNYRLGVLGFLSTEDDVVPGNGGLKDQVMALKWVQENIASFGGNPDSVTLTGFSAGSSSVHLHYFSNLSRGLFHKAFSQSGVALNPWPIQEEPLQKTKKLADAVGCTTSSTRILVECLKQRPARHLLVQLPSFFTYRMLPILPFGPVVEKVGTKPFINADPYILLKKGHVHDVPWLVSMSKHEGFYPVMFLKDNLEYIDKNWEDLAAVFLEFNNTLSPSLWKSTIKKINEFYLGSERINNGTVMKLMQIFTDRFFGAGAETAVRMQAKVNTSPVYYYVFDYPGDNNPEKVVSHGADVKYFFGPKFTPGPLTPNELKMKDLLLKMLIEFAKTGKPVFGAVDWRRSQYDQLTYLHVTGIEPEEANLKIIDNLNNRNFWDSLQLGEGDNLLSGEDNV